MTRNPGDELSGRSILRVRDGMLRQVAGVNRPVRRLASAVLPDEVEDTAPWGELAVVCDGVADPGNLATLVRTARGLGVDDVVLTDAATDLSTRRGAPPSRCARDAADLSGDQVVALMVVAAEGRSSGTDLSRDVGVSAGELGHLPRLPRRLTGVPGATTKIRWPTPGDWRSVPSVTAS